MSDMRYKQQYETKHLRTAALCLVSMLVMGMALAANSSAAEWTWTVCSEGKEKEAPTKYTTNQCTAAASELKGKWQLAELSSGKTETVRILAFTLRLTDLKAGPLEEESTIKCNGNGAVGEGIIEGTNKGVTNEIKLENAKSNCERVSGPCKAGEIEEVKGADLPWKTETTEGETKILADGKGEPGWAVKCNTILGKKTDECISSNEENAIRTGLVSEVTGGVMLVKGILEQVGRAKCSEAGKKETGEVSGEFAILQAKGMGLSIGGVADIVLKDAPWKVEEKKSKVFFAELRDRFGGNREAKELSVKFTSTAFKEIATINGCQGKMSLVPEETCEVKIECVGAAGSKARITVAAMFSAFPGEGFMECIP
jgi:hypothetical protein